MDSLLRLLLRFIVVPLGVLVGMFATMIVVLIGYWQIGNKLADFADAEAAAMFDLLATGAFGVMLVVLCMWLVAAIGILFSEGFGVRSWMFHAANGAISAWIGSQIFAPYADTPVPFEGITYVLAAGLAGGLAYWLVAGWSAGFWKPVFTTSAQPIVTAPAQPVVIAPVQATPPVVAQPAQPVVLPQPAAVVAEPVEPVVPTTPRPEPKLPRAVPAPPPNLPPAI